MVLCWNKIISERSTDDGGSGLKFLKIILFWHGTTALQLANCLSIANSNLKSPKSMQWNIKLSKFSTVVWLLGHIGTVKHMTLQQQDLCCQQAVLCSMLWFSWHYSQQYQESTELTAWIHWLPLEQCYWCMWYYEFCYDEIMCYTTVHDRQKAFNRENNYILPRELC